MDGQDQIFPHLTCRKTQKERMKERRRRNKQKTKWKRETKERKTGRKHWKQGGSACLACSRNLSELVPNGGADTDHPRALHSVSASPPFTSCTTFLFVLILCFHYLNHSFPCSFSLSQIWLWLLTRGATIEVKVHYIFIHLATLNPSRINPH